MNIKAWGRPYRTGTIPSSRASKPLDNSKRLPAANTSYSLKRDPVQKMQLNEQLITQRRENYLNSQFNRRRNTLKQMTKENKKIYERINSQKSLYSQDKMNRSTDSIRSLSRVSSRSSKKGTKILPKSQTQKNHQHVTIESQSIKSAKDTNLLQFRAIFSRGPPNNQENLKNLPNRPSNRSVSMRS